MIRFRAVGSVLFHQKVIANKFSPDVVNEPRQCLSITAINYILSSILQVFGSVPAFTVTVSIHSGPAFIFAIF